MNPDKQPYPTAKLKRLPDEVKDALLHQCMSAGVTQAMALAWLKNSHGVESSPAALSDFCSWWPARKRALAREQAVQVWMESEAELHPELSQEDLFRRGQRKFALGAIADDDPKAWMLTHAAEDSKERLALERTKAEQRDQLIAIKTRELVVKQRMAAVQEMKVCELILKAAGDARAKEIAASSVPNEEKIRLMREHFFADVRAIEQAGGIQLPE